jgi:hypothetical protein
LIAKLDCDARRDERPCNEEGTRAVGNAAAKVDRELIKYAMHSCFVRGDSDEHREVENEIVERLVSLAHGPTVATVDWGAATQEHRKRHD